MAIVKDVLRGIVAVGELVAAIFRSRKEAKKANVPTAEDAKSAAHAAWRQRMRDLEGRRRG